MSHNDSHDGHDAPGVAQILVPVMTITVDPQTGMPSYKCTQLPIAFWQMMVEEIGRQLEEQRRLAAAQILQQRMAEAKRAEAIAEQIRGRG